MTRQDSVVTFLLILLAIILIVGGPIIYICFDAKYYANSGDFWKEFWLPTLCSLQAALIAVVAAMCFLRQVEKLNEAARNEAVARKVIELLDDDARREAAARMVVERLDIRLSEMRTQAYQEAVIEILARLNLPEAPFSASVATPPEDDSNKESGTSYKSPRRNIPNKARA